MPFCRIQEDTGGKREIRGLVYREVEGLSVKEQLRGWRVSKEIKGKSFHGTFMEIEIFFPTAKPSWQYILSYSCGKGEKAALDTPPSATFTLNHTLCSLYLLFRNQGSWDAWGAQWVSEWLLVSAQVIITGS